MQKKKADLIEYALLIGIFVSLNILASHYFFRADLTEDKRYSISEAGKDLLSKVNDKLIIKIYLTGELDPGYDRLSKAVQEKMEEFKVYSSGQLEVQYIDPNQETDLAMRARMQQQLQMAGIRKDVYLSQNNGKKEEVTVFPGAVITYKEQDQVVNFLKGSSISSKDEQLNQSVETLEFEFLSALRKLVKTDFKTIGIVEGHGELSKEEMQDISNSLNESYAAERITISPTLDLSRFSALIIANPKLKWSEADKYLVDQYLMNGGSLLYFVDGTDVRKDSLKNGITFSLFRDLNLDDQFFKYGVRINPNLVQDLSCAMTRVQTGLNGEVQMLEFPYFPILFNFPDHPIVKNLDAIQGRFVSSVDSVKAEGITKTPLLLTSMNARTIAAPSEIDLNTLKKDLNKETLNQSFIPVAWLLEGSFSSLYKNRAAPVAGKPFVEKGENARIIVCADGDLIRNEYDVRRNMPVPLGYNTEMRYMFSNKEFILNSIDYLLDESIIRARSKEIKLRPLDKLRIREEKTFWQILNVVVPALLIVAFGVLWYYLRKKRFEKI